MKKLLVITSLALTVSAEAVNNNFQSFLQGNATTSFANSEYASLLLTNGSTYTYGTTNEVTYLVGNNYPFTISSSTPLIAYSTNLLGQTNYPIGASTGFTNITAVGALISSYNPYAYTVFGTNAYFIASTSGVTTTAGSVTSPTFYDVMIKPDFNGQISTNWALNFGVAGDSATSTNTVTFTVLHSADGNFYPTNNTLSISFVQVGTNACGTNYPVPASFMAGMRSLRLYQVVAGTNTASTNTYLFNAGLSGWLP